MKKTIAFLLIGILIGTLFWGFLFGEVKAELDEIYYLKKICNSLSSIESDLSSINPNVRDTMCSVK